MSRFFSFLLIVASVCSQAQTVKLSFEQGPNRKGTLTWTAKLLPDGRKQNQSSLSLGSGDSRIVVRSESVFAKDGAPIRMISETVVGGRRVTHVVAEFGEKGVQLTGRKGEADFDKLLPYPQGATWRDQGEFWFLRDLPKVDQKLIVYRLNLDEQRWNIQERVYKGMAEIVVASKKVKAHHYTIDEGEVFVDERGDPLKMELKNGISLVRTSSP